MPSRVYPEAATERGTSDVWDVRARGKAPYLGVLKWSSSLLRNNDLPWFGFLLEIQTTGEKSPESSC